MPRKSPKNRKSLANKKDKDMPKETKEIRKMRVTASFGKFRAKYWNGKPDAKGSRRAWNQKGIDSQN